MKSVSLFFLTMLTLAAGTAGAAVQQAFLVQNSGWMEPFYTDSSSSFKPLIQAVIQASTAKEDVVSLLAFSQTSGSNLSPVLLNQSHGSTGIETPLQVLALARKGTGGALADTDFKEAVTKTITGVFKGAPGIAWIFTNNKNSPGNDQATAARNQDFYKLLHLEPSIVKTVVFALKMPVKGRQYEARGMMVYALAYGQTAADELDRILKEGRLSKVLTNPPARLKPIDSNSVSIVPEKIENTAKVRPSLGADGRTLILDVDAEDYVPDLTLKASLQNQFFPYAIANARISASLSKEQQTVPVAVDPSLVDGLRPGQHQSVTVKFQLPIDKVPSAWSFAALAAMGKQVLVPMRINLELTDQKLALDEQFKAQLNDIFPGDPISDVLVPPVSVKTSHADVPLLLRLQYPLLPVVLLLSALLALVVAFAAAGLLWGRSTRYAVQVDGVRSNVMLKPFSSTNLRTEDGAVVATIKRSMGRPRVANVVDGHIVKFV